MNALQNRWVRLLSRLWAPLVRRSTFRRGIHLMLGGVVLAPYVVLTIGFVQLFADPIVPIVPIGLLALVTAVIGTVPPFLPTMRALEITASRSLLDVDLPDPVADPPWETRLLGAAWYVLHLLAGGLVIGALLFAAPMAVILVTRGVGADEVWGGNASVPPFDRLEGGWAIIVGLGFVVATGYLVAALGAALAKIAPLLLGPSPAELTLALEHQAEEFAERNRLARELHDSIGHALTVTTLQAAAARRVLDTDPEFAKRALASVEETGRAAMEDLDHVIGVLRARVGGDEMRDDAPSPQPSPQRTLADIRRLVDDTRSAGIELDAVLGGQLDTVPPAVSREAYRIVQEGLTNAVRHAGRVPVTLRVASTPGGVDIDISNPLPADARPRRSGGGRGLRGVRERVRLLRGDITAGAEDGRWRVRVHLPARDAGTGGDPR